MMGTLTTTSPSGLYNSPSNFTGSDRYSLGGVGDEWHDRILCSSRRAGGSLDLSPHGVCFAALIVGEEARPHRLLRRQNLRHVLEEAKVAEAVQRTRRQPMDLPESCNGMQTTDALTLVKQPERLRLKLLPVGAPSPSAP